MISIIDLQRFTCSSSLSGYLAEIDSLEWMMTRYDPSSPLERIIQDMQKAIEARLYYPALLVALTIPDICMGLTLNKSEFVKKSHYVHFVDTYTTEPELGLDGATCFQLRGGLVHRADLTGHAFFDGTHVVFTVPESGAHMHAFSIVVGDKTAAMFDLGLFCDAMKRALRKWYCAHRADPMVVANLTNLIRWRPEGIPPFVGGAPVIASGA